MLKPPRKHIPPPRLNRLQAMRLIRIEAEIELLSCAWAMSNGELRRRLHVLRSQFARITRRWKP